MAERATLGQWSFNGGEVSPRLHGRLDQQVYLISVAEMTGWLPLIQGPAVAAPGTIFVEAAAGPCRLIEFEYVPTQGYAIEASNLKFRFYTNDARIETAPGVPYEVAHPYSYAELRQLDHHASGDVLYLAGAGKAPRTLSRTGAETFALATLALRNGPIGPANPDEAVTVGASAATGAVTLTASAAIFEAGHVGAFFEIEAADYNDVKSWEPGISGVVGGTTKCTWAGKVYLAASGGRTGTVAPSHDSGTEYDGSAGGTDINGNGPYGVQWTFLHGRHGLLKITAFTDATHVTATVVKRLADSLTTTASWRWAFGAFSDAAGWPEAVTEWGECLVLAKDNMAYVSVIGSLDDFERRDSAGDFQRDLAGVVRLPDNSRIVAAAADGLLLLFTEKGEYPVERVQIQTGTPGPPVFEIKKPTMNGARKVKPVMAAGRHLFVQRAGRKLLEFDYDTLRDRYRAPDRTARADHIGKYGFGDLAWAAQPESHVWAVQDDGALAAALYEPEEEALGWCRRLLGNDDFPLMAKSLCRITDPEGKRDQLWLAVETESGAHWILRMAKLWETGDAQDGALFLDAALSYDGAPADEISGLDHLNGATVEILADGKPHPDRVVAGGAVTLDFEAEKVTIGLGYRAVIRTLPPEGGQQEGTAQTKLKRVVALGLRFAETQGIRLRVQGGENIPIETRIAADAMDEAAPLFSGDISVATIGRYDRLGQVEIERYQPTPATLVAVVPVLEVGEI